MKWPVLFFLQTMVVVEGRTQDNSVKVFQEQAQRKSTKTGDSSGKWVKGGSVSINVGQGGSRNWAAGAEKFSFSTAAYLALYASRKLGHWSWNNTLDFGYAFVNTNTLGTRKTDDKIDFFSKLNRDINKKTSISTVFNFRSQFTNAYDYNYLGKSYQRRTGGFFAPAYFILAPGLDWHPVEWFSLFFSPVSGRMVVVTNRPKSYYNQAGIIDPADGGGFELPLSAFYGVDPARQVRTELGGFASVNFRRELLKNITFKSRLDLYSNYLPSYRFTATGPDELGIVKLSAKPQNVDVYWTSLITLRVNKWIQATYNFDLIYDDDVRQFGPEKTSAAAQMRSLLAIGLAAKF